MAAAPPARQARGNVLDQAIGDNPFAEFLNPGPPPPPVATQGLNLGFIDPVRPVLYYSPAPDMYPDSRSRNGFATAFLRWPLDNPDIDETRAGIWAYTCIEFVFPGLVHHVLQSDDKVREERVILNRDDYVVSLDPTLAGTVKTPTVPGDQVNEAQPEVLYPECKVEGLRIDEACEGAIWSHVVGALTCLIFALGKPPTELNFPAFTEKRPQAIIGKLGSSITPDSPLAPARLPRLAHFRMFAGFFNMNHVQRRALVLTLIAWNKDENISPDRNIVVTQTKLWAEAGLTHMFLVRDFLINFGAAVLPIRGLATEIAAFTSMYRAWQASLDGDKSFLRVIDGDRAKLGTSRQYNKLLNLARNVAAAIDPRFAQYASGMGETPFKDNFIDQCRRLNIPLPSSYVGDQGGQDNAGGNVRVA